MKSKLTIVLPLLFVCFFLSFHQNMFAQSATITGKVSGDDGAGLEGVSVTVTGSSVGTVTGKDGAYSISVPSSATSLSFAHVGLIEQQVNISGRTVIDVRLTADAAGLDQVVVVGYATQRKATLTGAVSVLNKEALTNRPVTQISQALQGQMAGVTVTQNFGLPGSDGGTVRIRGIGTLGNNDALVLIDGIPGGLNDVNQNDIESLSVLKDAAAAAIYGSRGANGVILITTKRGKKNQPMSIEYNGFVTAQQPTYIPEMVKGYDYMILRNEEARNSGQAGPYSQDFINEYQEKVGTEPWFNTNWVDFSTKSNALQHSHNLQFTGGSEKLSTMLSLGYLKQDGLMENSEFKRTQVRFNNNLQASDRLSFSLDAYLNRETGVAPNGNGNGGANALFRQMYEIPAIFPVLWADGQFGEGWQGANPYAFIVAGGLNTTNNTRVQLQFKGNYKIFDWLSAELVYAPKYLSGFSEAKVKKYDFKRIDGSIGRWPQENNRVTMGSGRTVENNYRAILRLNKNFGRHNIGALAGIESIDNYSEGFFASRQNYLLQDYMVLNSGDPATRDNGTNTNTPTEWWLFSQFGRLTYSFDEKYLFEADFRYDGSSRFSSKTKQYGFFPSFSAAWRISEESFLKNSSFISNLKLRMSWGQLGNQELQGQNPNYAYMSLIDLNQPYYFGGVPVTGAAQTIIANELLTWETSTSMNAALEFGFLNNRLNGQVDLYKRNTKDILYDRDIPAIVGLSAAPQNIAEVQNVGWEFVLGWNDRINDFRYSADLVLSDVQNKVIDLKDKPVYGRNALLEGEEFQAFYGYEVIGIYRSDKDLDDFPKLNNNVKLGDLIYKDQNGDGTIDAVNDRKVIGSNIPRMTYGLTLTAGYKNFDLSIFLQGVGKKNFYFIATDAGSGGNYASYQMGRFIPDDPSTHASAAYPRLVTQSANPNLVDNSFYLMDAAYLRCKNVALSYKLPAKLLQRMKIKDIKIFVTGTNLFTIDDLAIDFVDPESPTTSTGASFAPNAKMYSLGLNVRF
mgnify:CR=1 FL=1